MSIVHISKGKYLRNCVLDDQKVDAISAFLCNGTKHDDPKRLNANLGSSFVGTMILGMGFTFDDSGRNDVATPIEYMNRLIEEDPDNQAIIFPYIGGEEVNQTPSHSHRRYVINFRDWPLRRSALDGMWRDADDEAKRNWLQKGTVPVDYPDPVAEDYPNLLSIIRQRVKPERLRSSQKSMSSHGNRARTWWQFYHQAKELYAAIDGLDQVLVISRVGQHVAFTFLPKSLIYAESIVVFAFDSESTFCVLQSRIHEIWARFFGSSMKDDLRYTPSDCFETFPFPKDWKTNVSLESAGNKYSDYRAKLMVENDEGMTKTYNRFHDPDERDPRIARLRELHAEMDRAVLEAYSWDDISTDCEFLLDYEIDEETWGKKKKPWRYRWPDDVHDEVLARLLDLNAERAAEERADGSGARRQKRQPR